MAYGAATICFHPGILDQLGKNMQRGSSFVLPEILEKSVSVEQSQVTTGYKQGKAYAYLLKMDRESSIACTCKKERDKLIGVPKR